jgi:hypothetical protein
MSKVTPNPVRWRDDGEWGTLAQDLAVSAGEGPSAEQQARLLSLLEPLGEPVQVPAAVASGRPLALKFLLVAGILGLVALYLSLRGSSASEATVARDPSAHEVKESPTVQPPQMTQSESAPHASQAENPPHAQSFTPPAEGLRIRRKRSSPAVATTPSGPDNSADPTSELYLLTRARRVLLNDPARSLALIDEHTRDYPRGMFVEEREVLAVEALLRAGKEHEAKSRGASFLRSHPGSAHIVRIRELLQSWSVGGQR